jgi:hypothetical protein
MSTIKTFGEVDRRSLAQLERCMSAGDAEFGVLAPTTTSATASRSAVVSRTRATSPRPASATTSGAATRRR